MALQCFIIEREIPKVGSLGRQQLKEAAAKSNDVLRKLGPDIQWIESFVSDDRMFCHYLATGEDLIRQHAQISGFPASRIVPIRRRIDPTTAHSDAAVSPVAKAS
jgi:hypothetical protein